ncbi:MAG: hypothetical protein OEZ13_10405 [Spirochaetia bacterium]|nr:hypothetical protein [Spirochaetia bacterium]
MSVKSFSLLRIVLLFFAYLHFNRCTNFEEIEPPVKHVEPSFDLAAQMYKDEKSQTILKKFDSREKIYIRNIYIFNRPINEKNDAISKSVKYFHWTTEKNIIQNELLIKQNEPADKNLILESERILRNLSHPAGGLIFKDAYIYLEKNEDKTYDAYVYTQDNLSIAPELGGSASGGYRSFFTGLSDINLFGGLYAASLIYLKENFIDTAKFSFSRARILDGKFQAGIEGASSFVKGKNNYNMASVFFQKPLLRLDDKYSFFLGYTVSKGSRYRFSNSGIEQINDIDSSNEIPFIVNKYFQSLKTGAGTAFGRLDRFEFYMSFASYIQKTNFINYEDQYNASASSRSDISEFVKDEYLPKNIDANVLSCKLTLSSRRYLTRKDFRKFLVTEDYFRGAGISFVLSSAGSYLGSRDKFYIPSIFLYYFYDKKNIRNESFLYRGAKRNFIDSQLWENDILAFANNFFYFRSYGAIAARFFYGQGNNLENDSRFSIGGGGGKLSFLYDDRYEKFISFQNNFLRGYPYRFIDGESAYLINFEYRSPVIKLPYLALSAAVFFDMGQIKDEKFSKFREISPLKSIGFGIRGGLFEFTNSLFRIDLGFPLDVSVDNFFTMINFEMSQTF